MVLRRTKFLPFVSCLIGLFVLSITISKQGINKYGDETQQKRASTETLFERRFYKNRGNVNTSLRQVKTILNFTKTNLKNLKISSSFNKNKEMIYYKDMPDAIVQPSKALLERKFPTVIILGVKKAGTRALLEALQMHPNVVGAQNEVYFFNGFHTKGLEWYRQKMPLSTPGQITVEKSPTYFTSVEKTQVVRRMFVFSRSTREPIKLLVVVRDPTTRCLSEYTDLLARSRKDEIPPINVGFESIVLNKQGQVNSSSMLVKTGLYIKHLKQWLEYFPPNEIHFVSGEGLVNNPYKEIKMVEKFLNLDPFFTENNFKFKQTKGFPCFVPDSSDTTKTFCLPPNKGRKHVKVKLKTLQKLREFYRPFNKQFFEKVKRDFFWN